MRQWCVQTSWDFGTCDTRYDPLGICFDDSVFGREDLDCFRLVFLLIILFFALPFSSSMDVP